MKNFEKNDMRAECFWENEHFFDKIRTEEMFFKRIDVFLTKYGHESNYFFFEKISSYWPFWGTIECSFDRLDAFWPIMCMTEGRFSYTIWKKMTWEHRFLRKWTFFYNILWAWELRFFREWTFFLTKYERESSDFFIKKHGKRAYYCLFWPIEYSSYNRIGFFFSTNYGHGNRAFFMKKLK